MGIPITNNPSTPPPNSQPAGQQPHNPAMHAAIEAYKQSHPGCTKDQIHQAIQDGQIVPQQQGAAPAPPQTSTTPPSGSIMQ